MNGMTCQITFQCPQCGKYHGGISTGSFGKIFIKKCKGCLHEKTCDRRDRMFAICDKCFEEGEYVA